MAFHDIVEMVARGLEAMGIAVVTVGGAAAILRFARGLLAGDPLDRSTGALRERLARATLLSLEFLVAADIIGTVTVAPTPTSLAMLAGIIVLRSFLSATLVLEVEGRWPWQSVRR